MNNIIAAIEIAKLMYALEIAASEKYKDEIVDTEMEELEVGPGLEYADKEDFVEQRNEYWIKEAGHLMGVDKC